MAVSFCSDWESATGNTTANEFLVSSEITDNIFASSDANDNFFASSEVADALVGFLNPNDSPLFSLDDLFNIAYETNLSSTPSPPDEECFFPGCASCRHSHAKPNFSRPPKQALPGSFTPPISPLPPYPRLNSAGSGGGLSVQNIAARERRKRIRIKTEELGRLVPSRGKKNTADVLLAVHNYVRYLQAQVSILGLMASQKVESGGGDEEKVHLQVLMTSPSIQERLSSEGMCLVPLEMVHTLATDPKLRFSDPIIGREIIKIIQSQKTQSNSYFITSS